MQAVLRRWWWVPVVVLAMLVVKAWVVAGMVQAEARSLAAEAANIDESRVEMDGLDVRLVGFADEASRDAAVAAVDALESSGNVVGTIDDDGDAPGTTELASEENAPAAGSPSEASTVSLDIASNGEVLIRGTVSSEARRSLIVSEIEARAGSEIVTDELVVDPDAVVAAGGELTVTGEANNENQRAAWVEGASAAALAAGLEFVDLTTVAPPPDGSEETGGTDDADSAEATGSTDGGGDTGAVEDALNALFELDPIEFDYNAATIRPGSTATLDLAATTINDSPGAGPFRVVGHTDSDGDADANLRLSQARADAVVAYLVEVGGVDQALLEAEGRGEAEPKIDPEVTLDDKQRNRRIEWERVE